ncbi:MAG: hypothetical protein AAB116_12310 [Candidatus Poribacteria bacterium]
MGILSIGNTKPDKRNVGNIDVSIEAIIAVLVVLTIDDITKPNPIVLKRNNVDRESASGILPRIGTLNHNLPTNRQSITSAKDKIMNGKIEGSVEVI